MDDAGRILEVCDIGDDSYGYAYLSTLLAERTSGPYTVAIAADSPDRLVPQLLAAAGWALAVVDEEATSDLTERFTEELADEAGSGPAPRRALGLARALQGGVLSATLRSSPAELLGLKPVLSAHSALATGRHAAAVALREVLRELYPAALRAYHDPADPVTLAVLDAVPEPGMLATASRGREAADAVAARLSATGAADPAAVTEAITALRVAIAETPRRGPGGRELAPIFAESVRQSVAAVRAYDTAGTGLANALAARLSRPVPARPTAAGSAPVPPPSGAPAGVPAPPPPVPVPAAAAPPLAPVPAQAPLLPPRPAPVPAQAPLLAPRPAPAPASAPLPPRPAAAPLPQPPLSPPPAPAPLPASPPRPAAAPLPQPPLSPPSAPAPVPAPPPPRPATAPVPAPPPPQRDPMRPVLQPVASTRAAGHPVSAPPPPPPGITPIGDPWRSAPGQPPRSGRVPVPAPRPAPGAPPRGSRSEWATHPPARGPRDAAAANGWEPPTGRVAPPWRADDLRPPEPPVLRLVEPTLPAELRDDLGYTAPSEPPSLRLVGSRGNGAPLSVPPVSADDDDTLLIFAETRSAWFNQEDDAAFDSAMDVGWQAAEQAAHPTVGDRTTTGLPRRVPRANLVPGAPPGQDERPVRVVRDPAAIAAHTSGYFNGWRRGQEVGGYPLRGRQSRPGGGWEFHREEDRLSG